MLIFGTRPEAIKMAPVVARLGQLQDQLEACVVATAQHRSMLDQVLRAFSIEVDYDLGIMQPDQSLADITNRALSGIDSVLQREKPHMVLVQGDTTTAFAGGLAAFYRQIPVGHIEAGLRTGDKYNPFPEEMNRCLLDVLADICFAHTGTAKGALLSEGIPDDRIFVSGNTVIDALQMAVTQHHKFSSDVLQQIPFRSCGTTVLVTAHRRESLGRPLAEICLALKDVLTERPDLQVIFPVHLNPKVRETVWSILGGVERAWLLNPLDYLDFVHLMKVCDLLVTDSGGIQEEGPALGKPVLVVRETTERPEAVAAGTARLIGTRRQDIVSAVRNLLDNPGEYARMAHAVNPFGDGQSAGRIVDWIRHFFGLTAEQPFPFASGLPLSSIAIPTPTEIPAA
jgi:UDP-N-acetylglucosamine 2-epimerase (non-hydrolysing)